MNNPVDAVLLRMVSSDRRISLGQAIQELKGIRRRI